MLHLNLYYMKLLAQYWSEADITKKKTMVSSWYLWRAFSTTFCGPKSADAEVIYKNIIGV